MSRSTLSCCLVIKNEQDKIASCLNNIDVLADEIVIVDTGSTDSTITIINNWVKKRNVERSVKVLSVGSKFHDADGDFDFGGAKTFALRNASKDFVMWLDATDTIDKQREIKKLFLEHTNKNKNVYFVLPTALSDEFAYVRSRIGPRETSSIIGRVHEFMCFSNMDELTRIFIPIPIQNRKKSRDLDRNLRLLLKEWEVNKTSRNAFYIALTYREMQDLQKAMEWYRTRVYTFEFVEEFKEEYYKALESIAEILQETTSGYTRAGDLFDLATQMIETDNSRVEGYYYMAKYYLRTENPKEALEYVKKCKNCKKPKNYKLWLNGAIYNGSALKNIVEECKIALKNDIVLKPDQILDLNQGNSTMRTGNSQYY